MGQPPVDHVFVKTTGSQAAAVARIGAWLAGRKLGEPAARSKLFDPKLSFEFNLNGNFKLKTDAANAKSATSIVKIDPERAKWTRLAVR